LGNFRYFIAMTPEAALQAQIERYREMTPEQRVAIALRLHELACEMSRLGIRRQNPERRRGRSRNCCTNASRLPDNRD